MKTLRQRWLAQTVLLVVAGATLGAPWAMLQAVAWTKMLKDYSARWGLAEGLQKTFDGQHPCPMCMAISKARTPTERADGEEMAVRSHRVSIQALVPSLGTALHALHQVDRWSASPAGGLSRTATKPPRPPP